MSGGVGCRCGSDLVVLWLWCRPAAAAPIQSLAWEPPYGAAVALKKKKKKKSLLFPETFSAELTLWPGFISKQWHGAARPVRRAQVNTIHHKFKVEYGLFKREKNHC